MNIKIVATLAGLVMLTGCGAATDENGTVDASEGAPEVVKTFWTKTVDGRRIPCVWAAGYNKAGLSCDWVPR